MIERENQEYQKGYRAALDYAKDLLNRVHAGDLSFESATEMMTTSQLQIQKGYQTKDLSS